MKAVIINGAEVLDRALHQAQTNLIKELDKRDWEVKTLGLAELSISPCVGCFTCWTKTPGRCVNNDEGRRMPALLVDADLIIMMTPMVYGGYGPRLKNALDRSIPILLPFFKVVKGEIHHPGRYDQEYNLLVIGLLPEPDSKCEEIFTGLVARNALNFSSPKSFAVVLYETENSTEQIEKLNSFLEKVGV